MATIRDLLNQVWSEFRKVGISYDLAIIEHIAAFLLEINGLESFKEELQARKPSQANLDTEKIKQLLSEAANIAGGAAKLLDSHIVFSLPNMLPGGGYPTPRHIVKTMACLAKVEPAHSLADITCGSGGLLVNHSNERQGMTLGVDISSEWAKLAYANIQLHGLNARILHHNALSVFLQEEKLEKTNFDRILINPPFGAKIDANLAERSLGQKVGSRSETALLALALQKLTPNGRAAVLAPSGLLFSNSTAEASLRHQLVDENSLEAVISFPKDAFQPYSPLQTHLLLFSKIESSEKHLTWFFQVEQDGYPAGRGRDLTQEASQPSDLPFLEAAWTIRNSEFDGLLPDENPQIGIKWVTDGKTVIGIICQGIDKNLANIKYQTFDSQTSQKYPHLLVELVVASSQQRIHLQIPLDFLKSYDLNEEIKAEEEEVETDIAIEQEQAEKNVNQVIQLLSHQVKAVAISFSPQNQIADINQPRLLGVAVAKSAIHEQAYDLRPEIYIRTETESNTIESPTALLAKIYRNQRQLAQRIDSLFGHLESPPIATQKLPSPIQEEIQPFGNLNQEQIRIWQKVCEKTEIVNDNGINDYHTAALFTLEEFSTADTDEATDVTRSTIDLLERMGLIVPVTIPDPKTNEPLLFYRRVTQRDIWDLDSGTLNSGEQSK
ncbi:HsdM family class I SAM-dependent methyltransferase [Nostoc sp.]|uniref:HsdM family class I SAM-dependent methyltransferase n=1 Tax=Nostoc sp. TaxID=1180 RepID=UPI002FF5F645